MSKTKDTVKWSFESREEHREQYRRLTEDEGWDMAFESFVLEGIRERMRAGNMSWMDCADLEGLAYAIDPDDVELLEPAGVPEF